MSAFEYNFEDGSYGNRVKVEIQLTTHPATVDFKRIKDAVDVLENIAGDYIDRDEEEE